MITSPSNPKIKETAKLRDSKPRRQQGLFLIDGVREVDRAVRSGIRILEIFVLDSHIPLLEKSFGSSFLTKIAVHSVSETAFAKIAYGERESGVVAVAEMPPKTLAEFEKTTQHIESPIFAVLEQIEKPGNVGAIFRSADGAGLDGILLADSMSDLFGSNTIRNSVGTVFRLPSVSLSARETIDWLRKRQIHLAVARCEAAIPYTEYDFRRPTAIVLGNEAEGLTELWQGKDVTAISLPMLGIADSLNVSNAAAILFYEARRQRFTRAETQRRGGE